MNRLKNHLIAAAVLTVGALVPPAHAQGSLNLLFYGSGDGSAADGHIDESIGSSGFVTDHFYGAGSFGLGWTHVAGDGLGHLLFYGSADGSAADGHIDSGGGGFITDHSYPAGSFGSGWTHIAGPI